MGSVDVTPAVAPCFGTLWPFGADTVATALEDVQRDERRPLRVEVSMFGTTGDEHPFREEAFLSLTAEEGSVPG